MMNATHHSSCRSKAALASRCCAALVFGAALVAAQSRIIRPAQSNSNNSGKRQHVATLRSSDTAEGSRVAINSDQSLSDYEAYRRGDRFYVRIPATDVPHAEATRGRGFADVKVQRGTDSTVLSFRLQPGATAHVEQRSNKLEVVFSAPGTPRTSAAGPNTNSRETSRTNLGSNSTKTQAKPLNNSSPKNAANANSPSKSADPNAKGVTPPKSAEKSGSTPGSESGQKTLIASAATPTPSPGASPKATPEQKAVAKPSVSPATQPTPATTTTASETTATSWQSKLKERTRYWILLAQL